MNTGNMDRDGSVQDLLAPQTIRIVGPKMPEYCRHAGACHGQLLHQHGLHDPVLEGQRDGFGFGMDLQLFIDMAHVKFDRVIAHVQLLSGGGVIVAVNQQF